MLLLLLPPLKRLCGRVLSCEEAEDLRWLRLNENRKGSLGRAFCLPRSLFALWVGSGWVRECKTLVLLCELALQQGNRSILLCDLPGLTPPHTL
jgi:hypothetical protein